MNLKKAIELLQEKLPIIGIGLVFLWSCVAIASRQKDVVFAGRKTVRIAHWQLEPGVRDGFAEAAAAYEKLHPEVKIIQEAIPESTYGQWLSTQFMGGTAPDIVQFGMVPANQITAFYARYITPISPHISRPNPYNAGTELEGVPLITTFKDGMRRSYVPELQEFMNIPLGLASTRLFYNKTLLHELTGRDSAPSDFREFIKVCEEIRDRSSELARPYTAIAGSTYHFNGWLNNVIQPLSHDAFYKMDFNRDGLFSKEEMFVGFYTERVDFEHPSYRAAFKIMREITQFFPHGWTGLNRDEAIFGFAQQRSVFISTGLWEAEGMWQQARGKFEIGVMDFPLPTPADPEYGAVLRGPRYESPEGGMAMTITNTARHPEIALDFLLFLTSQEQNAKFNERLRWIPIVTGAKAAEGLEIFEPRVEGVFPAWDTSVGPESIIRWEQLFSLYQINHIGFEELSRDFKSFYVTAGQEDYREYIRNLRRGLIQRAQFAAGLRARAMAATGDTTQSEWMKYRTALHPLLSNEGNAIRLSGYLSNPRKYREEPLYTYSEEALRNIKAGANAKVTATE